MRNDFFFLNILRLFNVTKTRVLITTPGLVFAILRNENTEKTGHIFLLMKTLKSTLFARVRYPAREGRNRSRVTENKLRADGRGPVLSRRRRRRRRRRVFRHCLAY